MITPAQCRQLVATMLKRITAVIKAKGEATKDGKNNKKHFFINSIISFNPLDGNIIK